MATLNTLVYSNPVPLQLSLSGLANGASAMSNVVDNTASGFSQVFVQLAIRTPITSLGTVSSTGTCTVAIISLPTPQVPITPPNAIHEVMEYDGFVKMVYGMTSNGTLYHYSLKIVGPPAYWALQVTNNTGVVFGVVTSDNYAYYIGANEYTRYASDSFSYPACGSLFFNGLSVQDNTFLYQPSGQLQVTGLATTTHNP